MRVRSALPQDVAMLADLPLSRRCRFSFKEVFMDFRWDIIIEYAPYLWKGTLLTIGLSSLHFIRYIIRIIYRIRKNN